MKKMVLGSCMAALVAGVAVADTVTSVNVVGYYNVTAAGDAQLDRYTLMSIPMTKMPVDRGVVSGNSASTITVAGAGWTAGQFAAGVVGQEPTGQSTFYIEVALEGSPFDGRHFYISNNTSTEVTLLAAVADLGADELVGATYRIIPANRIRDIFGEPGGDVSLASGTSEGAADNVILWTGTGFDSAIYYHAAGQWAQGASPANDVVIDRDEGFFVLRRPGNGDAVITVAGEVSSKPQAVVLDAGYNLIGGMSAVDQTLDETELDTVLQDGTSATEADTIVQWLGSGWDSDIYYHTAGAWAKGASPAGTEVLAAGDGYFVKVEGETSKVWRRPSPLQ